MFLTEADATEKDIVAVLCENMGLKQGQGSGLVPVLALLYWRGAFGIVVGRRFATTSGERRAEPGWC